VTEHPLATALASLGVEASVEVRETVAVLRMPNAGAAARLRDGSLRRAVIALATTHGFKTVAIELGDATDDRATVSGH
jgi:hypothetical protein